MTGWDNPNADPLGDLVKFAQAYRDAVPVKVSEIRMHRSTLVALVKRDGAARVRQSANEVAALHGFARCKIFCYPSVMS